MGVGGIEIAVADAGPLIHLAEIGCFTFLRGWDVLYISDAVWAETVEYNLQNGECEALCLCQKMGVSIVLT